MPGRSLDNCLDANDVYHGFMVSAGGAITSFDAPGAGTIVDTGTFPASINDNGVAGYYGTPGFFSNGISVDTVIKPAPTTSRLPAVSTTRNFSPPPTSGLSPPNLRAPPA